MPRIAVLPVLLLSVLAFAPPTSAAVPSPVDDPTHVSLSGLHPTVGAAPGDLPGPSADGCHVARSVTSARHCVYGNVAAATIVVAIGDSITTQWWAAIDGAAHKGGWRVIWMTKSGCPAADVTVASGGVAYPECDAWRRNVLAKVRGLSRVDLLVMSGSSASTLVRRADRVALADPALQAREWEAGYRRTMKAVAGEVKRVVILRDTPRFTFDVPACLKAHGGWTQSCSRAAASALPVTRWHAEQAVDASYDWVRATDMSNWICRTDRCWPVASGGILRYRDNHHLTNTFARTLAPAMYSRLRWLMP